MERSEVSIHEVRIFQYLQSVKGGWVTAKDVGEKARVAPRTARAHLLRFVQLGVADQAEVFPAHRYRLAAKADKRNGSYVLRLETAVEVFGLQHAL